MNVRPKKSKPSLADALFATGSLADAVAKSSRGGVPPGGETAETRRSAALSEWHKTVDTFRDDYKAKRKAAVKRSKRKLVLCAANRLWENKNKGKERRRRRPFRKDVLYVSII